MNINLSPNIPKQISFCDKVEHKYRESIKNLVTSLFAKKMYATGMTLGTMLIETGPALKAGLACPASWKRHFNFYGMNPKSLTEEQSKKPPILLLHGNYHNQSAWLSLAKKFKAENLGPVYTVNLPDGDITAKDFEIVNRKIEDIKNQYQKFGLEDVKIDLIAHSRGGTVATMLSTQRYGEASCQNWNALKDSIGKVITLGNPTQEDDVSYYKVINPNYLTRRFEIIGKYDVLETKDSQLDENHKLNIETGHLGLIEAPEAHQQIIHWLKA